MSLSHLIGTQAFLPALLEHIRTSATSPAVPLDQVIFQSILLCLIAGNKHLILRTPEEDVALTVQLTVWTLSCIFNMPTRKLKIRPWTIGRTTSSSSKFASAPASATSTSRPDTTTAFLGSLFIPPDSQDDDGSGDNPKHISNAHARRSPTYPSRGGGHKSKRPHSEYHPLSHIHGLASTSTLDSLYLPKSIIPGTSASSQGVIAPLPPPAIVRPSPIYPRDYSGRSLPHAYTDPLPHADHRGRKSAPQSIKHAPPVLPRALVVSNLEDAPDSVQRAFSQVLADGKVVLPGPLRAGAKNDAPDDAATHTWPLPEGFIVVYVCPASATERPAIHKTLLDKFAMSANVSVSRGVRRNFHMLPFATVPRTLSGEDARLFSYSTPGSPVAPHPAALPTHTPPTHTSALPPYAHAHQRAATYAAPAAHTPATPAPLFASPDVLPEGLLAALRVAYAHTRLSPRLELYLADTLSAARAHPRLEALLLTARAHRDAAALVRAARVLGADLTGAELLRPGPQVDADSAADEEEGARGEAEEGDDDDDDDDYRSALDVWVEVASTAEHGHGHNHESEPLMPAPLADGASASHAQEDAAPVPVLDAAEVHVARVVPRVVSHRVRLRAGPEDEVLASAVFGATFRPAAVGEAKQARAEANLDSVKAVLVQILAEV